jgi:hypothetical protein
MVHFVDGSYKKISMEVIRSPLDQAPAIQYGYPKYFVYLTYYKANKIDAIDIFIALFYVLVTKREEKWRRE